MKIVAAPDSFKGSLTAAQACAAIRAGALRAAPDAEIISVPMADGGEGIVESLIAELGGEVVSCTVDDPLGRPVTALYGLTGGGVAVIEMAQASGLLLLTEEERDPMVASTYGTGQLIRKALDRGAREFIMGIGGSATNDGGAGMAQALGFHLVNSKHANLPRGGGALARLARIYSAHADMRIKNSRFTVACDVDNPLLGPNGASMVFGPQKGATPQKAKSLDKALAKLATRIKKDLGMDLADIPGAGAAGGLGAGCMAFLGAELQRGADIVAGATKLAEKLKGADIVITGEGRTDAQTLGGKTVQGVAALAKSLGVPVIVISGSVSQDAEALLDCGVVSMLALMEGQMRLEEAMRDGAALLEERTAKAVGDFILNERNEKKNKSAVVGGGTQGPVLEGMKSKPVITAREAAGQVRDGDTVASSGFVSSAIPEGLIKALEARFLETGEPRDITYFYAGSQGLRDGRGGDHMAHKGLTRRVIAGHYNTAPALGELIMLGEIEGYNLPQGTLSQLTRDIAAHRPGALTHVGLGTFVDPRLGGGKLNDITTGDIVELVEILGEEKLLYKSFGIDVAFLRGSWADENGNVTMHREIAEGEVTALAQAAKNSGGKVFVQVEKIVAAGTLDPRLVKIPRNLVDALILADPEDHEQTYGCEFDPSLTGESRIEPGKLAPAPLDIKKVIARRAALELKDDALVNLGIGVPEFGVGPGRDDAAGIEQADRGAWVILP